MFPLFLLTTSFSPIEAMSGWLPTAARLNPLTYVFDGLRALTLSGWDVGEIVLAVAVSGALVAASLAVAFRALLARVR
jgi:ABC-2 type transport system permease protein